MTRRTNDRLLTQVPRFMQKESNFTNFWLLLQTAKDKTVTDNRGYREATIPEHPLGRSRV